MGGLRHLVPKPMRAPFARYSHAVEVVEPARWLFCSGQLGIAANDAIPDSAEAQAVLVLRGHRRVPRRGPHVLCRRGADQRLRHRPRQHGILHGGARPLRDAADARLHDVGARRALQCRPGAQHVIVGFETFGRLGKHPALFDLRHANRQGACDLRRDLVL